MNITRVFSNILNEFENDTSQVSSTQQELNMGRLILERIYEAQLPYADITRHNLRLKELDEVLEKNLVAQLRILNSDQIINLLQFARSMEQANLYDMRSYNYDIRKTPV